MANRKERRSALARGEAGGMLSELWEAGKFLRDATQGGARPYLALSARSAQRSPRHRLGFCVQKGLVSRGADRRSQTRALTEAGVAFLQLFLGAAAHPGPGPERRLGLAEALGAAAHPALGPIKRDLEKLGAAPAPPSKEEDQDMLERAEPSPDAIPMPAVPPRTHYWPLPLYDVASTFEFVRGISLGGKRETFRPREQFADGGYRSKDGGIDFRLRAAVAYGFATDVTPAAQGGFKLVSLTGLAREILLGNAALTLEHAQSHWSLRLVAKIEAESRVPRQSLPDALAAYGFASHEAKKVVASFFDNAAYFETGIAGKRLRKPLGHKRRGLRNGRESPRPVDGVCPENLRGAAAPEPQEAPPPAQARPAEPGPTLGRMVRVSTGGPATVEAVLRTKAEGARLRAEIEAAEVFLPD